MTAPCSRAATASCAGRWRGPDALNALARSGVSEAIVRWVRNRPNLVRGTYFVSWYFEGSWVGHILTFER